TLARIDPVTGTPLAIVPVGQPIDVLGFDGTDIWALALQDSGDSNSEDVVKIDTSTNTVAGRVSVDEAMPVMAVGAKFVWVSKAGSQPVRISVPTLTVTTLDSLPE